MSDKYVIYYLQTRACVVEWPGQCHFLLCRWQSLKQSVWTDDRVTGVDRDISTACSYRVASLRNKHLALKTKEQEMKQRWQPKILVIQDEISLVPAAVENMMLYRSMRARQDEGLDPASYFHPGELMGHIPILLIAGDFLQIKPANEISLADNFEELIRKMPHRVQTEHHAAQAALMTIDTVIHLKKSKRFLDAHLPEITTAMRTCTPAAPLSEDHLAQLRTRKIENCKKELTTDLFKHGHVIGMYWENIARSMVERANRDAQDLDVPLFCLQAADQRHSRKNKAIDKQLTHQLLTVPNPHRTGKLQGMLLVHENMVVRLADVLAPHLGLVKDKLAVVVKVDLHHEDQKLLDRREPGFCHFFPDYMAKGIWVKLLKGKNSPMEDALLQTWEEKFQNVADHTTDAKTLFFVELVHAECQNWFEARRGNRENWSDSLAVSSFAWHAAHCLQRARLDFGRRCAGWFASWWWPRGCRLVASHLCHADACPQTEEPHLARVHGASGGAFTQRPSYLLARTDWQVGNQSCFDAGAAAVLACLWCIASILTQCSASGT